MPEAETWRYRGQTIDREQIAFQRVHSGAAPQQSLEAVARVVRGAGLETGQRRIARRGVPGSAADAGAGRRDRVTARALAHRRSATHGASAAGSSPDRHHAAEDAAGSVRAD